jgi:hypothetical protein
MHLMCDSPSVLTPAILSASIMGTILGLGLAVSGIINLTVIGSLNVGGRWISTTIAVRGSALLAGL